MGLWDAYNAGVKKKRLEKTASEYIAWPRGFPAGELGKKIFEEMYTFSENVKNEAKKQAKDIPTPQKYGTKILFYLGYLQNHPPLELRSLYNLGPNDPFTREPLPQKRGIEQCIYCDGEQKSPPRGKEIMKLIRTV